MNEPLERSLARGAWWIGPLSLAPVALFLAFGARAEWLWRGALSWVVALGAKLPVMAVVGGIAVRLPAWFYGALAGLISAGMELGFALLAVVRARSEPGLGDIFLFAAAAGTIEALALFIWGHLGRPHNEDVERWKVAARSSRIMRHQFLIERSIAWLGHFGSRSLVALAVVARIPLLAALALLTFAITDGFAAYEHRRQVDWFSRVVVVRYFRVAAIVLSVELAVLAAAIAVTR